MSEFRASIAFGHVLGSISRNIGPAVRMSWPWLAIYAVVQAGTVFLFSDVVFILSGQKQESMSIEPSAWLAVLFLCCVSIVPFCSIAVNWHRFVLMGDEAKGLERLRIDKVVWRYVGNVILPLLLIVPASAVALALGLFLAFMLVTPGPEAGVLLWVVIFIFVGLPVLSVLVAWQRLMIKLPAIALGRAHYRFGDAWADSKGNNLRLAWFVLMLMGLTYGVGFVASAPLTLLARALEEQNIVAQILGASWQLAVNWVGWLVGINAITTLYGIFVERREV